MVIVGEQPEVTPSVTISNAGRENCFSMFGVRLFFWDEWDEGDDSIIYYNVFFPYESVARFNSGETTVFFYSDGKMEVFHSYDDEKEEYGFEETLYPTEITEYWVQLRKLYNK